MSNYHDLGKEQLVTMIQSLEDQLKTLYLEKRFANVSRDEIIEMYGQLEVKHEQMVTSLTGQLADLYSQVDQPGQQTSGSMLDVFKLKNVV